jgi:hypothetical protein
VAHPGARYPYPLTRTSAVELASLTLNILKINNNNNNNNNKKRERKKGYNENTQIKK